VIDADIGDIGRDHDFHRPKQGHHRRHADRETLGALPLALTAGGLVGEARLEDGLIFGRQRGLLGEPQDLSGSNGPGR